MEMSHGPTQGSTKVLAKCTSPGEGVELTICVSCGHVVGYDAVAMRAVIAGLESAAELEELPQHASTRDRETMTLDW